MSQKQTNSNHSPAPHAYKTFPRNLSRPTIQPLFFGHGVAVSRYDVQQYPIFEKLTEKQLSFFWRPEEIDVSKDRIDFASLTPGEQHVFIMNLKYQTLLDSVQGRSPNVALLPLVSVPELETWIETWAFSETIHSRSYTHILRNVFTDPSAVFDSIVSDADITKRAESVTAHYDALIEYTKLYQLFGEGTHVINGREVNVSLRECKKLLYLTIVSVNALEAIRFYVSFACSFAFVERELMEGNGKIIRMIARDEALHLSGTQHMLNTMANGIDDEMVQIAKECRGEAAQIFKEAAEQEKEWADVLFKHGSMLGLNAAILKNYVEYITNIRMTAIDLEPAFPDVKNNPIPWISTYFVSDNVQVAPQETEISSYLVGQIDNNVDMDDLGDFDL